MCILVWHRLGRPPGRPNSVLASVQMRFQAQQDYVGWLVPVLRTSPSTALLTIPIDVLTRCNRNIIVVLMKVWVDHMVDDFERVQIVQKALWEWLSLNHNSDKSYLLVTWKKTNKDRYVSRGGVDMSLNSAFAIPVARKEVLGVLWCLCSTSARFFSSKTAPSIVMKSLPALKIYTFKSGPLNVLMRKIRLAKVTIVISLPIAARFNTFEIRSACRINLPGTKPNHEN